ncbi:MAG TPA: radical SAM protein, partial [Patescibacteria group bacterium]|nr:radical SAM protein [Patescibacteria group bacterium]
MKKNVSKKSQIWLITTGFSCNNNCVMCSVKPMRESCSDRMTDEIVKDFETGRKLGYNQVGLTGGEPTIRSDIGCLIGTAKKLGYLKIGLNTNARRLSYGDFCEELVKSGLNKIIFTINGSDRQMFDAITDTPGAFSQTVQGVKNILGYPGIEVIANTVVFKMNYRCLTEIRKFISRLGVKSWHLLDLIPDGSAKEIYPTAAVPMTKLSRGLNHLAQNTVDFGKIAFFDFPLCL